MSDVARVSIVAEAPHEGDAYQGSVEGFDRHLRKWPEHAAMWCKVLLQLAAVAWVREAHILRRTYWDELDGLNLDGLTREATFWAGEAVRAYAQREWRAAHDAALRVALCYARMRDEEERCDED
jgi:hypothetical protein